MRVQSSKVTSIINNEQVLDIPLVPATPKFFKRTFRHQFKRRINQQERPILIITF
jgi:hypothetical protein